MKTAFAQLLCASGVSRVVAGIALVTAAASSHGSDFYKLTIVAESSASAGTDWRIIRSGLGINNAGLITWNADRLVNGVFQGGLFVGDGLSAPTLITVAQSSLAAARSSINNAGQGQVAFTYIETVNGVSSSRVRVWDRATNAFSDLYVCNQQPNPLPCESGTFSDSGRVGVVINTNPQSWRLVGPGERWHWAPLCRPARPARTW